MSRNYEQHPECFPRVRDCSSAGAALRAQDDAWRRCTCDGEPLPDCPVHGEPE